MADGDSISSRGQGGSQEDCYQDRKGPAQGNNPGSASRGSSHLDLALQKKLTERFAGEAGLEKSMSLQKHLARATPFEMGFTEFEGEKWQIILALTDESLPNPVGDQDLITQWSAEAMGSEKWIFLHIHHERNPGSDWSFGFDCNESEVTAFLRQLLKEKRLLIAFPDQKAARLDDAADRLVETLGNNLVTYLPGDYLLKRELKAKTSKTSVPIR